MSKYALERSRQPVWIVVAFVATQLLSVYDNRPSFANTMNHHSVSRLTAAPRLFERTSDRGNGQAKTALPITGQRQVDRIENDALTPIDRLMGLLRRYRDFCKKIADRLKEQNEGAAVFVGVVMLLVAPLWTLLFVGISIKAAIDYWKERGVLYALFAFGAGLFFSILVPATLFAGFVALAIHGWVGPIKFLLVWTGATIILFSFMIFLLFKTGEQWQRTIYYDRNRRVTGRSPWRYARDISEAERIGANPFILIMPPAVGLVIAVCWAIAAALGWVTW